MMTKQQKFLRGAILSVVIGSVVWLVSPVHPGDGWCLSVAPYHRPFSNVTGVTAYHDEKHPEGHYVIPMRCITIDRFCVSIFYGSRVTPTKP